VRSSAPILVDVIAARDPAEADLDADVLGAQLAEPDVGGDLDGWAFTGSFTIDRSGPFGYTVRVLPDGDGLTTSAELGGRRARAAGHDGGRAVARLKTSAPPSCPRERDRRRDGDGLTTSAELGLVVSA
jgi:hypothetical protein